jgi:hypothetical protein
MTVLPFIPKKDADVPDFYGMTVHLHSGKKLELEVVSHRLLETLQGCLSYATRDDLLGLIPLTSISHITFDKQFSKLQAAREAAAKKPE